MGRAQSRTAAVASKPQKTRRAAVQTAVKPVVAGGSLTGTDLHYRVGIDDNTYNPRRDPNCDCDSIHRCATLGHVAVSRDMNLKELAEVWQPQTVGQKYGAQRLLAIAHLTPDDFEVRIRRGYYGEEVGGITLNSGRAHELDQQWHEFLQLPEERQVPYLLEREYGHLLEALQDKKFVVEEVEVAQLIFGATDHYTRRLDPTVINRYRYAQQCEDNDITAAKHSRRTRPEPVPQGVVIPDGDSHQRIIDGYHRLASAQQAKRAKVFVYVARPKA